MSGGSVLPQRQNGMLSGSVNLVLPRPQEMHPSAKKGYVNQQAASCPRSAKAGLSRWSCCHWIRQGMHPTSRRSDSERELLDLHFHRGPRPESSGIRWGRPAERQKAKTKVSDQSRGESPKGQPPDHQARRRSRKETPFPSGAKRKGESYWPARRKKTQWMRTARKVQQRKPNPPMRKNRPE